MILVKNLQILGPVYPQTQALVATGSKTVRKLRGIELFLKVVDPVAMRAWVRGWWPVSVSQSSHEIDHLLNYCLG